LASKMFPFITCTWNPLGGACQHNCVYCWARKLAAERKMAKYQGEPRLIESICKRFKAEDFVFVCDMLDLLGEWVPSDDIKIVLGRIAGSPAQFLLLTKNPKRYLLMLDFLPKNAVLGCTIESDRNHLGLSKAPSQFCRLYWMTKLAEVERTRSTDNVKDGNKLFVSVEPILDFNLESFSNILCNWIKPWAVAIGYDNYANHLPEPPLEKTMQLIDRLEKAGVTVYRKTLRKAWNE
jgi:DNA repair photolyase